MVSLKIVSVIEDVTDILVDVALCVSAGVVKGVSAVVVIGILAGVVIGVYGVVVVGF